MNVVDEVERIPTVDEMTSDLVGIDKKIRQKNSKVSFAKGTALKDGPKLPPDNDIDDRYLLDLRMLDQDLLKARRTQIETSLSAIENEQKNLLFLLDPRFSPTKLDGEEESEGFLSSVETTLTSTAHNTTSSTTSGSHINKIDKPPPMTPKSILKSRSRKVGVVDTPHPKTDIFSDSLPGTESTSLASNSSLKSLHSNTSLEPRKRKKTSENVSLTPKQRKKSKLLRSYSATSMLTPAVILNPHVQGSDNISKKFVRQGGVNDDDDLYIQLAASHVADAIKGRGRFGKAHAFFKNKSSKRGFAVLSSQLWTFVIYLTIATHLIVLGWEQQFKPCLIGQRWNSDASAYTAVLVINALCILIYLVDIGLYIVFLSWKNLWKAKETVRVRVECVLTFLFILDFIILVIQNFIGVRLLCPFRCLRATMLMCKSQNVAHIFNVLLSIVTKLGKVFFIITIFIVTFACIGLHIFMEDYHDIKWLCHNNTATWNCTNIYDGAFDNLASATMHMFVLMSTENYPEVMIPTFERTWTNFFYFGLYLYAGVFFLTAILLAIIVESYWEYSKVHVKRERKQQREQLAKAWNLLDPLGKGEIGVDDPSLTKLFNIIVPKNSDEENLALIKYISLQQQQHHQDNDTKLDGQVVVAYDWTTKLIDALSFEFDKHVTSPLTTPRAADHHTNSRLKKFVNSKSFSVLVLVLILLHSVLFCLMWEGMSWQLQLSLQVLRTTVTCFFLLELLMRVAVTGRRRMLNVYDVTDGVMILTAVVANFAWFVVFKCDGNLESSHTGACVVVSSIGVLVRTFFISSHARSSISVLRGIYPVMFDLILLVAIIIFFYAVIGFEVFQAKTTTESDRRGYDGSYRAYECGVGFETFTCGLLMVFQIVITNDWHQMMLGAMLDAGWQAAFYFITCYLIINMIVMNLFVAISIEAYKKLAKYDRNFADERSSSINSDNTTLRASRDRKEKEEGIGRRRRKAGWRVDPTAALRSHLDQIFAVSSRRNSVGTGTWYGADLRSATSALDMSSPELKRLNMRRKSIIECLNHANTTTTAASAAQLAQHDGDAESFNEGSDLHIEKRLDNKMQLLKERSSRRRRDKRKKQLRNASDSSFESTVSAASGLNRSGGGEQNADKVCEADSKHDHPSPALSSGSSKPQRRSQIRMRRKNDGADWRRDIHGDMTVMNPDELKHLSRIFKGGLEKRRAVNKSVNIKPQDALAANKTNKRSFGVVDVMRRTSIHLPLVTVSEVAAEEEEQLGQSQDSAADLTKTAAGGVDGNKTRRRFPSWMQRFVEEKNLSVEGDVKLSIEDD